MSEREEIELLLPWYATGRLDQPDLERVERYLAANPQEAFKLEATREELAAETALNEAYGAPAPGGFERLMARIDTLPERAAQPAQQVAQGWLESAQAWLAETFSAPAMRYGAAAAAIVIMVQAAAIVALTQRAPAPGSFETASGQSEQITQGSALLIAFSAQARASDITALMREINGSIVTGPTADGLYRVTIKGERLAAQKLDQLVAKLEARSGLVRFAAPAE